MNTCFLWLPLHSNGPSVKMGNKASSASSTSTSPQKGSIKAPGYLASVLPFLEPGDGVRELEAYLRANPTSSQSMVAQALANQSVDAQFRRNVVALGGLRILRLLLTSDDHGVQLCAAHALGNLAVDRNNHEAMANTGCFHELMDLLSSGKTDLQCKAARAVTNLCVDDDNKHAFDQLGVVGALMALARHPNPACRTEAIAALGNLAVDDSLEIKIARQGGIEAVLPCVDAPAAPPVLHQHAARALKNLTTAEENKNYYDALRSEGRSVPLTAPGGNAGADVNKGAIRGGSGAGEETKTRIGMDSGDLNYAFHRDHVSQSSTIQSILQHAIDSPSSQHQSGELERGSRRETSGSTFGVGRKTMDEYAEAAARKAALGESVRAAAPAVVPPPVNPALTTPIGPPPTSPWSKILDPASNHYYWYNSRTKESTWTQPETEMAAVRLPQPPLRPEQLSISDTSLELQPSPAGQLSPTSSLKRGHGRKATQQNLSAGGFEEKRRTSRGAGRRGTLIIPSDSPTTLSKGRGKRGTLMPQMVVANGDSVPLQEVESGPHASKQQEQTASPQHQRKGTIASAMSVRLPLSPPPASSQNSALPETQRARNGTMVDAIQTLLPASEVLHEPSHVTGQKVTVVEAMQTKIPEIVAVPPPDHFDAPPSIPLPQVLPPLNTDAKVDENRNSVPPPRVPDGPPNMLSQPNRNPQHTIRDRTTSVMLPTEPHPVDTLSQAEKQIVDAINSARTNPAEFAGRLVQMKERLGTGNVLRFEWG